MTRPRVHVIGAGGTIAGRGASAASAAYTSGELGADELIAAVEGIDRLADLSAATLFSTGSEDLGPADWFALADEIQATAARDEVDGIVVTHGTDTLEEAALFLHLTCPVDKPLVMTAAMRPATGLSADGPANLYQAVQAASERRLAGAGATVAMNGLLMPGARIYKSRSAALETFRAYPGGPIGRMVGERLMLDLAAEAPPLAGRFGDALSGSRDLPHIPVATMTGGCGDAPLRVYRDHPPRGLVIAAFGGGTMPDSAAKVAADLASTGTVVVVASRLAQGLVLEETMTPTDGSLLLAAGVLNPPKSAVYLALALDAGTTHADMAADLGRLTGNRT